MASYTQVTLSYEAEATGTSLSHTSTATTETTLTWDYDAAGDLSHSPKTLLDAALSWDYDMAGQLDHTPTAWTHPPEVDYEAETGVPIPTGQFRSVDVTIRTDDEDAERMGDLAWVLPAEKFPVAVPVREDGTATLRLLKGQIYTRFQAIAPNPDSDTDFVWYESQDTEIGLHETEETLYFKREPIESEGEGRGRGLFIGRGVVIN